MKIELKKLAIYPRLSEETTAFTAELWIGGARSGLAKNDGHGGGTTVDWRVSPEARRKIEEALKSQVPVRHPLVGGVEWAIDAAVEDRRVQRIISTRDARIKRGCARRGTGAARFDVRGACGDKETTWIEYPRGKEQTVKVQLFKRHPTFENWTVVA